MEHVVTKMEFLVVDVMEAENQNVIITNKGEFCTVLPASYFKQWNGYEGYCVENRCIGVVGTLKKEFTLDKHTLRTVPRTAWIFCMRARHTTRMRYP